RHTHHPPLGETRRLPRRSHLRGRLPRHRSAQLDQRHSRRRCHHDRHPNFQRQRHFRGPFRRRRRPPQRRRLPHPPTPHPSRPRNHPNPTPRQLITHQRT